MTDKTRADVKGGTLIQYGGRLRLLEVAQVAPSPPTQNIFTPPFQVPKDHMDEFMDVKKFNVFNTNNLWISMPAIQRVVREKALDMEIIVNPVIQHIARTKALSGALTHVPLSQVSLSAENTNAYQLVTAIGAAMKCFDNAIGLNVPRSA